MALARPLIRCITIALCGLALTATLLTPAHAERVVVHDPRGDARGNSSYDIHKVKVLHKQSKVKLRLDQRFTPYFYVIRVDTPGGRNYDYVVSWSVISPRKVFVYTREQYQEGGRTCTRNSARTQNRQKVLVFTFPRRCLGWPGRFRVRAYADDDQFGTMDRTRWSSFAARG